MSKMGGLNLEIEDEIHSLLNAGNSHDDVASIIAEQFKISETDAENKVYDLAYPDAELDEPFDSFSDAEALASAGFGTDEDYGGGEYI